PDAGQVQSRRYDRPMGESIPRTESCRGEDLFALASTGPFRASVHGHGGGFVMPPGPSPAMIIAVAACPLVFVGAGQAGAGPGMPAGARAAAVAATWHTAQRVPGTAILNKGGNAQVQSVS